jgi:hypothetical protein
MAANLSPELTGAAGLRAGEAASFGGDDLTFFGSADPWSRRWSM